MLRHDWLVHGSASSRFLDDYPNTRLPTSSKPVEDSLSPSDSLVELELHTSSFFDTARLRDKEQQPRHRASAIPISTRYLPTNNPKLNLLTSRPSYRRPISLALDDSHSTTNQALSATARRPASPPSAKALTYASNDRYQSPLAHRYTLAAASESTALPSYLLSYDLQRQSSPKTVSSTNDISLVAPHPIGPSVFTTSAIKFAPAPLRRLSPPRDPASRLAHSSLSNIDDSLKPATNDLHRRSLFTPTETSSAASLAKQRLLDDNNNFLALRIYD